MALAFYFCVLLSQLAMTFAHEHFSKFQLRTYPKTLFKCNNMSVTFGEVSQEQEKEQIISYLDCFKGDTIRAYKPNITQENINKFNEMLRQMTSDHWRVKRQARSLVRSEVRALTPGQWNQITNAFNRIFRSGIFHEIATLHSDTAIGGAHGGPAFLGWHRIYLLWIEFYLRFPIPYWDSSLDFHLANPIHSIVWTRHYFGNGRGRVRTGPFSSFTEPDGTPISRDIGRAGTLIARENIESIINRNSNLRLVYTTLITLEGYHNGPHVWMGGTVRMVTSAPSDPCFWFHHSFVDKLWRDAQRNMRNPENYPYQTSTNRLHRPRENMVMFRFDPNFPVRNEDGYRSWVARRTTYARSPGQATERSQCENPSWRIRRVLVWDVQRQICVSGEGEPSDFDTPPDTQANRLSSSAFNDGSNSALQFISPIRDQRTMIPEDNTVANTFRAVAGTSGTGNLFFNNAFTSPLHDVRTVSSSSRSSGGPPFVNQRSRSMLLDDLIMRLRRRQNNQLAEVASITQPSLVRNELQGNNMIGFTSGTGQPVDNNAFFERVNFGDTNRQTRNLFGQTGQMIGQTGQMLGQTGQMIGETGQMIGQTGQMLGQTGQMFGQTGQINGQISDTPVQSNSVISLLRGILR
ncbi:uncharacterized protein LOC132561426 [Ylistrum balloti]|uniref:uncharacterized protein LOC132561426 n=1 Tax=Ylistrum balloti TaxID=509963 RepID=UPI002905A259|nr:uncharacterized protein LOC132561426 [Ylistrum balloti]